MSRQGNRIAQISASFVLFLFLAGGGITKFFGGDDVMNLYKYYEFPFGHWLAGVAQFWSSDYYRPLGGVAYLALFKTFGFNALPFKILLFAALLFNMFLFLRLSARLAGSLEIAAWALLFCCYHAAFNGLYLNFGTIYDVLGYSFFFGAFLAYIRFFTVSRRPWPGLLLVLLLYILGLDCKEVVVTLPAVLFAYCLILSGSVRTEKMLWPLRSGLPVIACSAIAIVYTAGKMTGQGSLTADPSYMPHFTFVQYSRLTAHYMHELFYLPAGWPTPVIATLFLILLIVAALLLRSRLMLFSAVAVIITQLPVSFIGPRGAFVIYIPLAFWALYAAAFVGAATLLLRSPLRASAAFAVVATILVSIHLWMKPGYDHNLVPQTIAYGDFSHQLDRWNVHLTENGRALIVNDPFPQNWIGYDTLFLMSMRDHTTHAVVNRLKFATSIPPESEIGWYDYVIDYDTDWRLLKSPSRQAVGGARLKALADNAPLLLLDGFDPPSLDGWRMVRTTFAMRAKNTSSRACELSVSLSATEPVRLSEQLDDGVKTNEKAYAPGPIQIVEPIPPGATPAQHDLRLWAHRDGTQPGDTGSPGLIFVNAVLPACE